MNSVCSQAAAAECLEHSTSSDGAQSDTSNTTPTAKRSSKRGLQTAFCTMRQSLGTFENLSAADAPKRITEWLTLSARDSRASRSQSPANNAAQTTSETCGLQLSSAFAWFDRDSLSWKTSLGCCLPGISEPSSVNWPRAAMTFDGACYRQPKWEHRIGGNGCGLWPTPTVQDSANNAGPSQHHRDSKPLNVAVLYPTPSTMDAAGFCPNSGRMLTGKALEIEGKGPHVYPTPRATDGSKGGPNQKGSKGDATLPSAVQPTGKSTRPTLLNPNWVEWLMGWPVGWTGLEPLVMDKFRWWLRSHGVCSPRVSE